MVDGTYKLEIDSPMGKKPGTLVLRSEGANVYADIDAPVIGKQHVSGVADGDKFSAEGVFKMLFVGKINYSLNGEVSGDDILISIKSSKGDFDLRGVRA